MLKVFRIITGVVCLVSAAAYAEPPWDGRMFVASPVEVLEAAKSVNAAGEPEVVVLLDETHYTFDEAGRRTKRTRVVYQIKQAKAVQNWSRIETDWSPWYEERPELRARVITLDGQAHELDPATIDDAPARDYYPDLYTDDRILRAPLPAVAEGAIVEQEVLIRENRPLFEQGVNSQLYFGRAVPVQQSRLILEAPQSISLQYVLHLLPNLKPQKEQNGSLLRLTFETGPTEPINLTEYNQGSDTPIWPAIVFSSGRSWKDVASAYSKIVDEKIAATGALNVFEDIKGNRETVIAGVLKRLHEHVRYTGVEFGESSIIPQPPGEILKRKYGDCKDQASLLVAALRNAGISAHVALLNAGYAKDVEPGLPGLGLFNHAIVYVPGEKPVWIDPTNEFARAGQLPLADQGRYALIADADTTALIRTPQSTAEENVTSELREVFLRERGDAKWIETARVSGTAELGWRQSYAGADAKTIQGWMEDYAKESYLAKLPVRYELSDPRDVSRPFQFKLEMDKATRGVTDETEAVVAIFVANISESFPSIFFSFPEEEKEDEKRKTDYVFTELFTNEWNYRIVPPPGFEVAELPQSEKKMIGGALLEKSFERKPNGEVTALVRLQVNKRKITPQEFQQMQEEFSAMQNEPALMIRFEQLGMRQLTAGNVREALQEFRKLADLHPKEAMHHAQIAQALFQGGLGEAAREEIDRAIAIEPGYSDAYRIKGWILEHDLFGRQFKPGFDHAGAIAAYRKAKELDPSSEVIRGSLAILLEHDSQGTRYSKDADLSGAIAEYRALEKDLKFKDLQQNLLICLMWNGQFQELVKNARAMDSSEARDQLILIGIAASESPENAIKEAARLISDSERRRSAIEVAGRTLVSLRIYPAAVQMLNEAVKGSTNAAILYQQIDLLKKTKRYEAVDVSGTEPVDFIKKFLVAMFRSKGDHNALSSFFSKHLQSKLHQEKESYLKGFMTGMLRGFALNPGVPVEVGMDGFFTVMQYRTDGNEDLGFRIQMSSTFAPLLDSTFYIVRENKEYRIAAYAYGWDLIAEEVLRRVEANDLAGAEQWLNWVREEMFPGGEDPMGDSAFTKFWSKGDTGDASKIRYAAAALLSETDKAEQVIPVLKAGKEAARSDQERMNFDLALLNAYSRAKKYSEVLALATQLTAHHPKSLALFSSQVYSLLNLKKLDELVRLASERLQAIPDDPVAIRALADAAEAKGDLRDARKWLQKLIDAGKATANDYNEHAWFGLFEDQLTDQDLESAQRAVNLTRENHAGILHTLATLYAQSGRTVEALHTIRKALDQSNQDTVEPHDWYVFGLLAEQYNLKDVATECYRKVKPDVEDQEEVYAADTSKLAEMRLQKLNAEARKR